MSSDILSHPDKFLREHTADVLEVGKIILKEKYFGKILSCSQTFELIARLHDTGKGSAAFQKYIIDPDSYTGDRKKKAHTPLSLFLAGLLLENIEVSAAAAFAIFQCVAGHHGELFAINELKDRYVTNSNKGQILKTQFSDLDIERLFSEVGLKSNLQGRTLKRIRMLLEDYLYDFEDYIKQLSIEQKVSYRLLVQYLFSVLIESDRAYLIVPRDKYKDCFRIFTCPENYSFSFKQVDHFIKELPPTPLNAWRREAREEALSSGNGTSEICTLTLPTGMGKTLTSLSWALQKHSGSKIVVVLPYLSIIDQTEKIYREIFPDKRAVISYHSLSSPEPDSEVDSGSSEFFYDTWSSDIVITTYDQLLLAFFSSKTKHLIRFHKLCGATILIDEIQTLPCKLWNPVSSVLAALCRNTESRVLAMSATQPDFFGSVNELISNPSRYFDLFDRYTVFLHLAEIEIDKFEQNLGKRILDLEESFKEGYKLLITLNTRSSARRMRKFIENLSVLCNIPKYFLSSDVTPQDRLEAIVDIKRILSAVVVSTQCVEAGVDIDMDEVWRDFAPLDSLVQIAGRCNRNGKKHEGIVKIFSIKNEKGKNYANMVYRDGIRLEKTREVLKSYVEIKEKDVLTLCRKYFHSLQGAVNQGRELVENFAGWEEYEDVHEILRGKTAEQHQFIVVDQHEGIKEKINRLLEIEDRWERRREYRRLAGDITRITVSIYAEKVFDPFEIAEKAPDDFGFWYLKPEYYSSKYGLELPEEKECYVW